MAIKAKIKATALSPLYTVRFKELDMASCSGYSGDIIKPI